MVNTTTDNLTVTSKLTLGAGVTIPLQNMPALNGALVRKADLHSAHLTGIPTAPTALQTVSSTQIATTEYVRSAVSALVDGADGALNTLKELGTALGDSGDAVGSVLNQLGALGERLTTVEELSPITGATGPDGAVGATGATGLVGATGPAGTNGTNGTNGIDGLQGPAGADGAQGPAGVDGAVGATGPDGADGTDGVSHVITELPATEAEFNTMVTNNVGLGRLFLDGNALKFKLGSTWYSVPAMAILDDAAKPYYVAP